MPSLRLALVFALVPLLAACGDDDDGPGPIDAAAGADGAAIADAPAPATDAPSSTADAPAESPDGSTSRTDAGQSIDGGGTEPPFCGGFPGFACTSASWCDYPDNICGAADGTGTCEPRPDFCPDVVQPVCGCDGNVYGNSCEARAAGADLNALGGCTPPADTFSCGYRFCDLKSEYCQWQVSDVFGVPDDFSCLLEPDACEPDPSCACLVGVPCGGLCMEDELGGLTVTCPGG